MKHASFIELDVVLICVLVSYAGCTYYLWGKVEYLWVFIHVAIILLINPMYRLYLAIRRITLGLTKK
jgi:hypothetical protein